MVDTHFTKSNFVMYENMNVVARPGRRLGYPGLGRGVIFSFYSELP